jgi:uncharacterized phiE125 gp8 family phage protein
MSGLFHEIHSTLERSGEPASLPVTIDEMSIQLDLDPDNLSEDEKTKITAAIFDAVDAVERDAQRALVRQTWKLYMDEFPCEEIELRTPPVISVTTVTYIDTDGDSQTYSSSNYTTDLKSSPARIFPAEGTYWPSTDCQPNAVTVTFVAGYPGTVPRTAWRAIVMMAKALYYGCEPGEAYWSHLNRIRWEGGI